jgi:hypothetical protein
MPLINLIIILVVVGVILWLLSVFGVIGSLGTSCQEVMNIELIEIRLTWRCCMLHGSNATLLLHATPFLLKSTTFDGSHLAISIYTY